MLEIIYNDSFSQLSIINKPNEEKVVVVDEDFKVYTSVDYGLFSPSNDDYKKMWRDAVYDYFKLGVDVDLLNDYRQRQSLNSVQAFDEWLDKGGMY